VVTSTGALPPSLLEADHPPLVVVPRSAPGLDALRGQVGPEQVAVAGDERVDPPRLVDVLAERGWTRVLCEGGPHLMAGLVRADLVDELCLTVVPRLVGGPALRMLHMEPWLEPARRARLHHLLHADGTLLTRWQVLPGDGPA